MLPVDQPDHEVFLSHARADAQLGRLMRGYLRSHNIRAWFDQYELRLEDALDDPVVEQRVFQAIEACRFFVVLVSRASLASSWVLRELEYALARREREGSIAVIGVLVDSVEPSALPAPFARLRMVRIASLDLDPLQELRETIGKGSPTYIGHVEPNFIKHITLDRLTDHLERCPGRTLDLWFLNGAYSMEAHVLPALKHHLRLQASSGRAPTEPLRCRLLLSDSALLHGSPLAEAPHAHRVQEALDGLLRASDFLLRDGVHHELVRRTARKLLAFAAKEDGLEAHVRLTPLLPAARMLLGDRHGFLSPFLQELDARLPVLVFDRHSPLFPKVRESFDEAWLHSRDFAVEDLND